jgi:CheY-like chemotaxis protein
VARVHLVHWDPAEGRDRQQALARLGHAVAFLPGVTGTPLMRALRAGGAEAVVIDLSRRPSHGREIAMALRSSPATRRTPLIFAGGETEKIAALRTLLPDAAYTTWGRMKTAIPKAMARPPAAPVVPADRLYAGRSLAQKLGIGAGERVAALSAPREFAATLGALPEKARLTATLSAEVDRVIWFLRTPAELQAALARLAGTIARQVVWLAWPKKASGLTTALDGNVVREAGLAAGLVDFKVCSIDATWSGLAFKRAKR